MLTEGQTMHAVVAHFDDAHSKAEIAEALERLRERNRNHKKRHYASVPHGVVRTLVVPQDVMTDALSRAALVPANVTAWLMGDPLPGRGATAHHELSPSIVHDPLDDLIYRRASV